MEEKRNHEKFIFLASNIFGETARHDFNVSDTPCSVRLLRNVQFVFFCRMSLGSQHVLYKKKYEFDGWKSDFILYTCSVD